MGSGGLDGKVRRRDSCGTICLKVLVWVEEK